MSTDLSTKFLETAALAKNLKQCSDDDALYLYGHYKQATVGDNDTEKPSFFSLDFVSKRKWEAWDKCRGLSVEHAMVKYIEKATSLIDNAELA